MGRSRWWAIAGVVLGALVLSSCASTGYHYVKSSEDRTYFKVPDEWRLYDETETLDTLFKSLSPREREQQLDMGWHTAFDASPKPAISKHFFDASAKHPVGLASVEQLEFDASDQVSLNLLRNFFVPIDDSLDQGTGEVLSYEQLQLDGGFHGIHLVANVDDEKGRTLTFNQISVVDQSTSKLYTLVVTCNANCYEDNQDKIDRVVDSWTVKD